MAQIAEGSCEAVGPDGPQAAQEKRKQIYARSKTIDEPVFGQTKKGRVLRRLLLRGLGKVNEEWLLWGTTHNLNKVWRYLKQQDQQQAMAMG